MTTASALDQDNAATCQRKREPDVSDRPRCCCVAYSASRSGRLSRCPPPMVIGHHPGQLRDRRVGDLSDLAVGVRFSGRCYVEWAFGPQVGQSGCGASRAAPALSPMVTRLNEYSRLAAPGPRRGQHSLEVLAWRRELTPDDHTEQHGRTPSAPRTELRHRLR